MTRTPLTSSLTRKSCIDAALDLYPPRAKEYFAKDPRLGLHSELAFQSGGSLIDVGSGFSPFGLAMQLAGMSAVMMDRFDYPVDHWLDSEQIAKTLKEQGVVLVKADLEREFPFGDDSQDVITCFAVIEHFHNSPASLFGNIRRALKPKGKFIFSCPNSVNLRKRLAVLLGRSNYAPVQQIWESPRYHGHVREPNLAEMVWMAEQSKFKVLKTLGMNGAGVQNYGLITAIVDPFLRLFPTLCSDLYVICEKTS
jgi:SAM-dependent methyltransferase